MAYRLYKKHRTAKHWTFVKDYKTMKAAKKHSDAIRANPNKRSMIKEVKGEGSDTRKSGDNV
jgi:hypothetical protein